MGRGWELSDDHLVIRAEVKNVGDGRARQSVVRAWTQAGWRGEAVVRALGVNDSEHVSIDLRIAERRWGQRHSFTVVVDPDNFTGDSNRANNRGQVRVPLPGEDGFPLLLLVLGVTVVAVVVVGGTGLTIRYRIKTRRRREWQKKAKEEGPAEPCQPCTRYCRVSEVEVQPALRKITHLTLVAQDPASGEKSQEREVKGEIVDRLNEAVGAHRRRPEPDKLQTLIAPVAGTLLQEIAEWLRPGPVPRDVSVAGHLEGGKVTVQFVLYHCRRKGNVTTWKQEDKWKATLKDERVEPVTTLRRLDPTQPGMPERVIPELAQRLVRLVEKVSA